MYILGCIAVLRRCGLLLQMKQRGLSVCGRSVCLSQSSALQKRLNRSRCRLGCGLRWAKEARIRWGAYWCHLANTTEPSMCGDNAALRQITLTTCLNV